LTTWGKCAIIITERKEREVITMTKYAVSAFGFYKEFTNKRKAEVCFEKVKHNFTYCEFKKVNNTAESYYAESIKIFTK
jgi:hypothetical protein